MKKYFIYYFTIVFVISIGCNKEPGPGGRGTIYGKVLMQHYDSTFTTIVEEYYAPERDVFIVYGSERSYGERVRTNPEGLYEFKFLRTGIYTIYVYSKDIEHNSPSGLIAVEKQVEITYNTEEIVVDDLIICK